MHGEERNLSNQRNLHDISSLSGMRAVITGTGGLGLETSVALAKAGADVVVAGRSYSKGEAAVAEIKSAAPQADVSFAYLDLAKLDTIADFARSLQADGSAVDILVNNAGIMSPPIRQETADGFELQFGVNYLGHFALTGQLLPLLRSAPAPRVISVTSLAHRYAKMDLGDLQSEKRYQAGLVYCRSKLAQALFVKELQHRSERYGWGILSLGAHPGFARTNLFKSEDRAQNNPSAIISKLFGLVVGQSAADGARPIIHAALSPDIKGGQLFGPRGLFEMKGAPGLCDFASYVQDVEVATQLWGAAENLTKVHFPTGNA